MTSPTRPGPTCSGPSWSSRPTTRPGWSTPNTWPAAGDHEKSDTLYEAIGPRRTRGYRDGPAAGIPFAVGVWTGRGFITDLTVTRAEAGLVGAVLRSHPVERVMVLGPDVTVSIIPDQGRRVMTYHPGVAARNWGAVIVPPRDGNPARPTGGRCG